MAEEVGRREQVSLKTKEKEEEKERERDRTSTDFYSIIIPTYNEKDNVPFLIYMIINEFKQNNLHFEVLLVDDNSQDNTAEVYEQLQKIFKDEKLLLLRRDKKLGLGSAYKDALQYVSGNFIIIMDADLSHHPKYIHDFIRKQKSTNCDIVTGSRYTTNGGICGWNFKRIIVSRAANFLTQFLLFINLTDLTGSFRLYKADVFRELMKDIDAKGYVFQMEIIVRAQKLNKKIEEVGYVFVDRLFGKSKLGGSEIVKYLIGLLKLFWSI